MGPQRSRWRCPKRDGPGQIEELAVEIGFRFVNRMSHLATPDLSPGTTAIQRVKRAINGLLVDSKKKS